jgi:hypothetical protein
VTGFFYATAAAGQTNLASNGLDDVFVAKFAPLPQPRLNVARAGANVVLSWSVTASGFVLESALVAPTNTWTAVSPAPATNGMFNVVTQTIAGAQKIFRLRAP